MQVHKWQGAIVSAGQEIAESIGLVSCSPMGSKPGIPEALVGAHVPLVNDELAVQLAIQATSEGNEVLARSMLCMEEGEELEASDIADCICEIANMLAGCVKRRVLEEVGDLRIGLPVYIDGRIAERAGMSGFTIDVRMGEVAVSIVLVGPSMPSNSNAG